MATFTIVLVLVGTITCVIGWLMVLFLAFRTSIGWGLGSLFISIVWLIFVARNWEESKTGFFTWLGGMAVVLLTIFFIPSKPATAKVTTASAATTTSAPEPAPPPATLSYAALDAPKAYVPPPATTTTAAPPAEEAPQLEKVYADRATNLYYTEKCNLARPATAVRLAKSVAIMQGYQPACQ